MGRFWSELLCQLWWWLLKCITEYRFQTIASIATVDNNAYSFTKIKALGKKNGKHIHINIKRQGDFLNCKTKRKIHYVQIAKKRNILFENKMLLLLQFEHHVSNISNSHTFWILTSLSMSECVPVSSDGVFITGCISVVCTSV